jgi:hypothetical protein
MASDDIEDEALVLAAAVFSGQNAAALLQGLHGERGERCRKRLREASGEVRERERLGASLRRLFTATLADVPAERIAERLSVEPPALQALALMDLPAPRAAEVAALLGLSPTRPAAPAPAVHAWLRKRWLGDLLW